MHARTRPHAVAILERGRSVSYARLVQGLLSAAAVLRKEGVGPGDVVAVSMAADSFHLMLLLALARLGALAVPIPLIRTPELRGAICLRYGVGLMVSDRAGIVPDGIRALVVDAQTFSNPVRPAQVPADPGGDRAFRLGMTSGTLGTPKAVPVTHERFLQLAWFQDSQLMTRLPDRYLTHMDINISAGFNACLFQLIGGRTVVLSGGSGPDAFFEAVDRYGPTVTQAAPVMLGKLADAAGERGVRCPGLTSVFAVGSLMTPALRSHIRERLAPNIYARYGSTETGQIAIASAQDQDDDSTCVGEVAPWIRAEVVDEDDRVLAPGREGRLRFRGFLSSDRYHDDAKATADVFRNGWVYLGDIGAMSARGRLFLRGRADDLLNVNGVKMNPAEIETVLVAHPAVAQAGAFAMEAGAGGHRLVAAVVVREGYDPGAVLVYCRKRLGPRSPVGLVSVSELPRNPSGKLDRRALPALSAGAGAHLFLAARAAPRDEVPARDGPQE